MTLPAEEFLRRFLLHVLPGGFHRIRHYGVLASGRRAANIARIRKLIGVTEIEATLPAEEEATPSATAEPPCPCCGGRMRIVETFVRGHAPRTWPTFRSRIDTS